MGDAGRPGSQLPQARTGINPSLDNSEFSDNAINLGSTGSPSIASLPPAQSSIHMASQRQSPPGSSPDPNEGNFAMGTIATALPNLPQTPHGYVVSQSVHRYPPGASPNVLQQQHQMMQYAGHAGLNSPIQNQNFNTQYVPQYPGPQSQPQQTGMAAPNYMMQHNPQQRAGIGSSVQQTFQTPNFYPGNQTQNQQYMYYPQVYGQMSPSQHNFPGHHHPQDTGMGGSGYRNIPANMQVTHHYGTGRISPRASASLGQMTSVPSPSKAIPSAPRGPPRKPKQSGHALWVGNLPPGALVTDLKDHFSREATNDIESVFLISKSNCAFVNYRSEEACTAAMTRFHDSRFHGVRLVCRLRRSASAPAPGVPTGPAASQSSSPQTQTAVEAINQNREVSMKAEESMKQIEGAAKINDKYFVVKSLTVEDLELSARTGIWATQAHNEDALNKAYETVDNVYLIFSANKSGEYFGYARMASPINEESAANLEWSPRAEIVANDPELPRSIPTSATDTAPKGRIIDDSARGTIFWEAEPIEGLDSSVLEGATDGEELEGEKSGQESDEGQNEQAGAQAFGRPFKIEWVSTNRLPFYRTRGLRNPWNANREVKIARDGTELETSVGRRLVQMFHRTGPAQQSLSPVIPSGFQQSSTRPY